MIYLCLGSLQSRRRRLYLMQTTSISQMLSLSLVLCCLAILPKAEPLAHRSGHQIHERMSPDELRTVFHVQSHEEVPEYDLTDIKLIKKRSVDQRSDANQVLPKQIRLNAFGKKLELNLHKNQDFNDRVKDMKVYMAETTSNGKLRYSEAQASAQDNQNIGTTYHDKSNMAAILVNHTPDGSIQLHGTIGNDLVIRPIPETVSLDNTEYLNYSADDQDDEMFLDEDETIEVRKKLKTSSNKRMANSTQTGISQLPVSTNSRATGPQVSDNNTTKLANTHVIYKRNMFDPDNSHSDYCKRLSHYCRCLRSMQIQKTKTNLICFSGTRPSSLRLSTLQLFIGVYVRRATFFSAQATSAQPSLA